jgi:hypothetical protein
MGTLNSWPQSVQTPTAGVVLSHSTTLRRRWIMGSFSSVETVQLYSLRV